MANTTSDTSNYVLHDSDIREPLFDYLEDSFGRTRIIEEKTMGRSRADVVMVTPGLLYGIEIKSDADSYTRLASQVKDYDKFFDRNIVVVGSTHALHIREHVPEYWGVITVELVNGLYDFYMLRQPVDNPKMKCKNKLRLMWRPELAQIQLLNNMPKYREKSKDFVIGKIAARADTGVIDSCTLNNQITELLFERDYTTIAETLTEYRRKANPRSRR